MATTIKNKHFYVLLNPGKNLTVDLDNGKTANGTTVNGYPIHQYYTKDPGQQVWQVVFDGEPNDRDSRQWVRLVNRASGTFLDLKDGGMKNSTPTQGWQSAGDGFEDNQRWHFQKAPRDWSNNKGPICWTIINKAGSSDGTLRVLDTDGTPKGTPCVIWEFDNLGVNPDQLFIAFEVEV